MECCREGPRAEECGWPVHLPTAKKQIVFLEPPEKNAVPWTSDLCCYKAPSYWSSVPAAVDGADRHRAWSEACWAHPGTPTRFIQEWGP